VFFLQIPKIGKKHKGKLDRSARSKELTAEERQAENKWQARILQNLVWKFHLKVIPRGSRLPQKGIKSINAFVFIGCKMCAHDQCSVLKLTLRLFTTYKNFPEIPIGKQMVHDFSGRSSDKFPGASERLKR